jgi:hypothetical protein
MSEQQMEFMQQLPIIVQIILGSLATAFVSLGGWAMLKRIVNQTVEIRYTQKQNEIEFEAMAKQADFEAKQKERLTVLENKALEVESRVKSAEARDRQIEAMIIQNGEIAQRRSDDAREFTRLTSEMQMNLNVTLKELNTTLNGISESHEIQTMAYGTLNQDVIVGVETVTKTAQSTNDIVSTMKADLQQVQNGLGKLGIIVDDLVTNQEAHIDSAGKRHTEQLASNQSNHVELKEINIGIKLLRDVLHRFIQQLEESPQPLPSLPVIIKNENNEEKEE